MSYNYRVRFIADNQITELVNLYHLARTAVAGNTADRRGRYDRMLWAAKEFAKHHDGVTATGAYKDLDGLLS